MVRYINRTGKEAISESSSNSFHLSHPAGGYISLGHPNITRYQGLARTLPFGETWELFKFIENISVEAQPDTIILTPDAAERISSKAIEHFSVSSGACTYDVKMPSGKVSITLDIRAIHDFEKENRNYSIQDVPSGHVITYSCPRYTLCLAIIGAQGNYKPSWREVDYPYDKRRDSLSKLWVYDCLEYDFEHSLSLRFGVGWNPAQALADANKTSPAPQRLFSINREITQDSAAASAALDLERATLELPNLGLGIIAGYHWFYQVYTRDEAISAGALIALGDFNFAKKVLLRQISLLHSDGRISNRTPNSELESADGVGWAFLRLRQLFELGVLSEEEKSFVHGALTKSLRSLENNRLRGNLIYNDWKETWMDTTGGSIDGREGARIEIQALTYSMYCLAAKLCNTRNDPTEEYYLSRAAHLKDTVKSLFYNSESGALADGLEDHVDRTQRPNIFIAAYAAPELFRLNEWKRIISTSLAHLWLDWGGLTTIDKEHLLFTPRHTGENDISYHRGDSWYFLNNIAAIVLAEIGFERESEDIYRSSKKQLSSIGIPGHAAETSSASEQEAFGCFAQTWSASTFVELHLGRQKKEVLRPGLARFY